MHKNLDLVFNHVICQTKIKLLNDLLLEKLHVEEDKKWVQGWCILTNWRVVLNHWSTVDLFETQIEDKSS